MNITDYTQFVGALGTWIKAKNGYSDFDFPLLYSPKYGLGWAYGCTNPAEEFFARSFPPLTELIESEEYRQASLFERLRLLGYRTVNLDQDLRIHEIPENLPLLADGIMAQFKSTFAHLFPQTWERMERELKDSSWSEQHFMLNPREVVALQVYHANSMFHQFSTYDGSESP